MKKAMQKFDIDGDGSLKLREILLAFKMSQDRVEILKYSLAGLVLGEERFFPKFWEFSKLSQILSQI